MQSTYLWLRGVGEVLDGVRRCWASYFNAEALSYRAQHGGRSGMSVAVQYMVDARVAGVMFTLNPVSGDPSSIAIDASYGLGVTVVGGEVTPDSYLFSKVTRELVRSEIGAKEVECVADPENGGTVHRAVDDERRGRHALRPTRSRDSPTSAAASSATTARRRTSNGRSTASSTRSSSFRPGPRPCGRRNERWR